MTETGGEKDNPLQYSCLENPMGRGAWQAAYSPLGHKESDMTKQLHFLFSIIFSEMEIYLILLQLLCTILIGIL